MADWVGSSGSKIRPYRSLTAPMIRQYEESTCASTATLEAGDVVTNNTVVTTGGARIVRAPSSGGNGTNLMQVGITSVLGVVMEKSTSDGSTTGLNSGGIGNSRLRHLSVCLARPTQEFIGYNSSLETGNGVANPATLIGATRPLVYDRTFHTFFVASTNSTAANAAVRITDIPVEAIGDSGAFPIIFTFLSSNVGVAGGSQ